MARNSTLRRLFAMKLMTTAAASPLSSRLTVPWRSVTLAEAAGCLSESVNEPPCDIIESRCTACRTSLT